LEADLIVEKMRNALGGTLTGLVEADMKRRGLSSTYGIVAMFNF
jgi:hypothetical protein